MASFGETLKREREVRQVSLRDISDATRINLRYLEALEQNRFDALPGGVFNKGFIRAYATHLGLDGDVFVDAYQREIAARKTEIENMLRGSTEKTATARPRRSTPGERRGRAITSILDVGPRRPLRLPDAASRTSRVLLGLFSLVAVAGLFALGIKLTGPRQSPTETEPARIAVESAATSPEREPEPAEDLQAADTGADEPSNRLAFLALAGPMAPAPGASSEPDTPRAPHTEKVTTESHRAVPDPPPATPPRRTDRQDRPRQPEPQAELTPPPQDPTPATLPRERGPMVLRIETARRTWVLLTCDSRRAIDRMMEPGESMSLECLSSIRVSAHDAAAVILSVNAVACLPLGEEGSRVYGYTIRNDDYHLICPPGRG